MAELSNFDKWAAGYFSWVEPLPTPDEMQIARDAYEAGRRNAAKVWTEADQAAWMALPEEERRRRNHEEAARGVTPTGEAQRLAWEACRLLCAAAVVQENPDKVVCPPAFVVAVRAAMLALRNAGVDVPVADHTVNGWYAALADARLAARKAGNDWLVDKLNEIHRHLLTADGERGNSEIGKRSTSAATASGHELPNDTAATAASLSVANGGDARVASAGCPSGVTEASEHQAVRGVFAGESMAKAAEGWAAWCERRHLSSLSEFLIDVSRALGVDVPVTRQSIHDEIVRQAGTEFHSPPLHGGVKASDDQTKR